jgi:penicillin-binding protein 1C
VRACCALRIVLATASLCLSVAASAELPSFQQVRQDWRPSDAWLLDRHGRELQRVRLDDQVRRFHWTALADISPALRDALLASEDQRFFEHEGVDWQAAMHAALGNAGRSGGQATRGASTITMQLAALLDPPRWRWKSAGPRPRSSRPTSTWSATGANCWASRPCRTACSARRRMA